MSARAKNRDDQAVKARCSHFLVYQGVFANFLFNLHHFPLASPSLPRGALDIKHKQEIRVGPLTFAKA